MNNKELMVLYGQPNRPVSEETWASWLEPIRDKLGEQRGKLWSPKQMQIIIEHLGPWPNYDK